MKFRHILTTLTLLSAMLCSMAQTLTGEWRVYPSFNNYVDRVVETPDKVYFMGQVQAYMKSYINKSDKFCSLFAYDKKSEEIQAIHSGNYISRDMVLNIAYNPEGKYLLVVNDDLSIDLVYDNGKTYNISTLAHATLPGKKLVNNISFMPDSDDVYISTEFGYTRLDAKSRKLVETHIYDTPVYDVVRVGDRIVVATANGFYVALESEPRFSLNDYTFSKAPDEIRNLLPLEANRFLVIYGRNNKQASMIFPYRFANATALVPYNQDMIASPLVQDVQPLTDGWVFRLSSQMMHLRKNLTDTKVSFDKDDYYKAFSTLDFENFYLCEPLVGISKFVKESGEAWKCVKSASQPNAPTPFNSYSAAYSDKYGMLMGSHGIEGRFGDNVSIQEPLFVAGFKDGFWKDYSPMTYDSSLTKDAVNGFVGMAIDPSASNYLYRGSLFHGLIRINLDNPADIISFAYPSHALKGAEKHVDAFPTQNNWNILCGAKYPQFDNDGNLVFIYNNYNDQSVDLYSWTAADRKAFKSASDFKGFDMVHLGVKPSNADNLLVLRHKNNRGKAIVTTGAQAPYFHCLDYGNTLADSSDDKVKSLETGTNQDGATFTMYMPNCLFEDPLSGLVWIGKDHGLFTMNPATFFSNPVFNQIKVSRNDGTDLADYLLNNVSVSHITEDGQGRKWISTNGGGIVVTSNDGKKIIAEIKSENSKLPSDVVNSCHYIPSTGSMMISTSLGMAEFTPSGGGTQVETREVRAYPNPVEPNYYGYVTIDNLPSSCLVKIVDAAGGIVRDLGVVDNGAVQWDVMGMDFKRVKTGVYYVLVSGTGTDSESSVGKILVMN